MFKNLFSRKQDNPVPHQLYGGVVAQARNPVFFTNFGFEDSVTGRFDVLCLHVFLFSRRLVRASEPLAADLNQEVFDIFTEETDRALRELGVGDTSVPKRKKKMVRTFYAMVEEFSQPLDAQDISALAAAVTARFASAGNTAMATRPLTAYILETAANLDSQSDSAILSGKLQWHTPYSS